MSLSRRQFIKLFAACGVAPVSVAYAGTNATAGTSSGIRVVDAHSQLIETNVSSIQHLESVAQIQQAIKAAGKESKRLAVCGARHAGGGQQFATDNVLIDMTRFGKVISFDRERGLLELEPGIRWPELLSWLEAAQRGQSKTWGVLQKQTGNDALTVGGAISANAHGQGLKLKPLVQDVESLRLVMSDGSIISCSRTEHRDLFAMVLGGYGLFGLIVSVTMRLVPRAKFKRIVQPLSIAEIPRLYSESLKRACIYADFQCNVDESSDDYLSGGLFSYYEKMDDKTPLSDLPPLDSAQWVDLVCLAHKDKRQAFKQFSQHLLSLSGKSHWPEVWQSSAYVPDYHRIVDERVGAKTHGTEVLTELYVPLDQLPAFIADVRDDFRNNRVDLIYSTIRFIDTDDETFMPWARTPSACIIFNLHVDHIEKSIDECRGHLQRLIDHAIKYGGRYYLTYHRYAGKEQVLTCYPEFPELLKQKLKYDPQAVFGSDWYRHYVEMFSA